MLNKILFKIKKIRKGDFLINKNFGRGPKRQIFSRDISNFEAF